MSTAVFYARVSSDLQKKEKTIESQIEALKKQIAQAGDILVKEYVDDGWTGVRLDRPALDELRKDIKTNLFDTIYFWNTDRIARKVTYQTIIIAEILKHKKRIIINGKDYVENPENTFTLQILGAVAELEREKIIERSLRGKQRKLAEGVMMSAGGGTFGYDYINKTSTATAKMVVNEHEARIVRFIFDEFTANKGGMHQLTRKLEDKGIVTKRGSKLWNVAGVYKILRNPTYTGIKYFNRMKTITEYANPLSGTVASKKRIIRDKSEWVGIPVPVIIPKDLFAKAQERLEWNKSRYRSPKRQQLLSLLIHCGHCGSKFCAYQRYYLRKRKTMPNKLYHHFAYRCARRFWIIAHSKKSLVPRCESRERNASMLESQVFHLIENVMLNPAKLRDSIDIFKTQRPVTRMEKELEKLEKSLRSHEEKKCRITDVYAEGNMAQDEYVTKSRSYDNEITALTQRKATILQQIPLFRKRSLIDEAIEQYCETARLRYRKAVDFETKRQFLLDHVEKIMFWNDKIVLHGQVPVTITPEYKGRNRVSEPETHKIEFRIEMRVRTTAANWVEK